MLLFLCCVARQQFTSTEPLYIHASSDKLQIRLNLPDIADKRPEPKRAVLLGIPVNLKNI